MIGHPKLFFGGAQFISSRPLNLELLSRTCLEESSVGNLKEGPHAVFIRSTNISTTPHLVRVTLPDSGNDMPIKDATELRDWLNIALSDFQSYKDKAALTPGVDF